jgi:hypothetical protein
MTAEDPARSCHWRPPCGNPREPRQETPTDLPSRVNMQALYFE